MLANIAESDACFTNQSEEGRKEGEREGREGERGEEEKREKIQ